MDIPAVVNNNLGNVSALNRADTRAQTQNAAPSSSLPRNANEQASTKDLQKETQKQVELTRDQAEELAKRIESQINIERRSLSFQLNDNIGKTVVSVIDVNTDEVIRQIPSEDLVRLAEQVERLRAEQEQASSGEKDLAGVFLREQV